jgi:hypothetical protein
MSVTTVAVCLGNTGKAQSDNQGTADQKSFHSDSPVHTDWNHAKRKHSVKPCHQINDKKGDVSAQGPVLHKLYMG